ELLLGWPAAVATVKTDEERVHPLVIDVGAVHHRHAARVDLRRHLILRIEDEQFAAGHAAADLVLDWPENENPPPRQILAGVLARRLSDDGGARVADSEAVPGAAADEDGPARRSGTDIGAAAC